MQWILCAIRDSKAELYGRLTMFRTRGEAIRGFIDECNRAQDGNVLYSHAEDFTMEMVGIFEDGTGAIEGCRAHVLVRGVDVRSRDG